MQPDNRGDPSSSDETPGSPSLLARLLGRTTQIDRREMPAVIASFLLIFCVMCGYFAVRSVRETAGTFLGKERVANLFLVTWLASLAIVPGYGWVVARFRRARFLPVVYGVVAASLALVGFLLGADPQNVLVMEFFYVMISVLNLFMLSVFWGFLLEIFAREQTKRLFGVIAAGGSAGALVGPWLTTVTVTHIGNSGILYLGASLFVIAIGCQRALLSVWHRAQETHAVAAGNDVPVGGNPLIDGARLLFTSPYLLGIAIFVILLSSVSTFLYFEQLRIVSETFKGSAQRTQVFAIMDAIVQTATLLLQLFVTGRIATRLGITTLLVIVPAAMIFGFLGLAAVGTFGMLAFVFCARRIGEYAFVRPGREMLFSTLSTEDRYRVKHVIDVPVYRGGDALSSQVDSLLQHGGLSPAKVAVVGSGLAALWLLNAWWLGRRHESEEVMRAAPAAPVSGHG
ncbi:MAG TPA: MFS transporter [Steroidobacteraceae bacterium]|nr:MFS transporter [Steroidobacteraceae bacterium]